jgi:hypothetical protein
MDFLEQRTALVYYCPGNSVFRIAVSSRAVTKVLQNWDDFAQWASVLLLRLE